MQGQGLCQARIHTHKHKTTKPQFYKTTPNLIQRRGGMSVTGEITNFIPRSFLTLRQSDLYSARRYLLEFSNW